MTSCPSRTLETPWAVFSEDSSPFARRSPAVDFPLRRHASTCSSCPTTAKRASCATSCATLLAWTPALSSPNHLLRRVVWWCLNRTGGVLLTWCGSCRIRVASSEWKSWRGRSPRGHTDFPFRLYKYMEELCVTFAHWLASTAMLSLQHNPIPGPLLYHSYTCSRNLVTSEKTVAASLFLRLNRNTRRCNNPVQGDLESNTDAMQAIRQTWSTHLSAAKRCVVNTLRRPDCVSQASRSRCRISLKMFLLDLMHLWEMEDKS